MSTLSQQSRESQDGPVGSSHVAVEMSESAKGLGQRDKHPWELDAKDLEIGRVIGRGAHGQVFQGTYKGTEVAIKTLFSMFAPSDSNAFDALNAEAAAEAEALSRLHHVNMMRFYGICYLAANHSIAMVAELCASDLQEYIETPGWFCITYCATMFILMACNSIGTITGHPDKDKWNIAIQIARGWCTVFPVPALPD